MCGICERINETKEGKNPSDDNRPSSEELEEMKEKLLCELDKLL